MPRVRSRAEVPTPGGCPISTATTARSLAHAPCLGEFNEQSGGRDCAAAPGRRTGASETRPGSWTPRFLSRLRETLDELPKGY